LRLAKKYVPFFDYDECKLNFRGLAGRRDKGGKSSIMDD
jgi:hypothetical protein